MALTAAITTNTTTATKKALCGTYSFHGTGSTLDSGRRDQVIAKWTITSAPTGYKFQTIDPRFTTLAGQATSSIISPLTTGLMGWTFAFPMSLAGSYTVRLDLYDPTDGATSFATTTVTVAAAPTTILYLDEDATGSADGSSWDDAYTNAVTAAAALQATGGDAILYVREGTSYTPSARTNITVDNVAIICDNPDNPFTMDLGTAAWIRFQDQENATISGVSYIDTVGTDSSIGLTVRFGTLDLYAHKVTIGATGNRFSSMLSLTTTVPTRIMMHDLDASNDFDNYAAYATGQIDVVGGVYIATPTATERPFRMNDSGSGVSRASFSGVTISAGLKNAIRFQSGEFFTVDRCKLTRTGTDAGSVVSINGDEVGAGADARGVRISRNLVINNQSGNGDSITYDDKNTSNDSDNTVSICNNIIISSGVGSSSNPINVGNGAYSCSVIGNTIDTDVTKGISVDADVDNEVVGNLIQYTGPAATGVMLSILPGSGTTTVEDNVLDKGLATGTDFYEYAGGGAEALAAFNAESGVSGNTEATVSLNADYFPASIATYTVSGGLDYYDNALSVVAYAGAVQSVPSAPTVVNRTPADNATGVSDAQTISMQFSENMAINISSAVIELRQVSDDSVLDSITAGDVTINISDRTQVTLTGLLLSGVTGEVYVYISATAFRASATGLSFAGYLTATDWNFTVGALTSGNRSRIRDGQRLR